MARALIETYGCTLNHADSDIMEHLLKAQGIDVVNGKYRKGQEVDCVIVNTCTVKNPTETRILDRIKKISAEKKRLIVTGCMASANADKILAVAPGSSIVTTNNIHRITDAVEELGSRDRIDYSESGRIDKLEYATSQSSVISRIPISEGCLSSCSFCETKFARGPLNSFSERLILKAIEMNVRNGSREIELTSQDVGAYGLDRGTNIAQLLLGIGDIEGDFRVRVGMLNPEHLDKYIDSLISAYSDRRIYRFVHLPVQSGSNKVLNEMQRRYTIEQFNGYVAEIRSKVPGISIETDVIVGYPTETDEDYEESVSFISSVRPTFTNVSKFGARPHAKASRLMQIDNKTVKERSSNMSRIARSVQREDFSKLVGTRTRALVTEENNKSMVCRDDSYRIVALDKSSDVAMGDFVDVEIIGNTSVCLIGRPL